MIRVRNQLTVFLIGKDGRHTVASPFSFLNKILIKSKFWWFLDQWVHNASALFKIFLSVCCNLYYLKINRLRANKELTFLNISMYVMIFNIYMHFMNLSMIGFFGLGFNHTLVMRSLISPRSATKIENGIEQTNQNKKNTGTSV